MWTSHSPKQRLSRRCPQCTHPALLATATASYSWSHNTAPSRHRCQQLHDGPLHKLWSGRVGAHAVELRHNCVR